MKRPGHLCLVVAVAWAFAVAATLQGSAQDLPQAASTLRSTQSGVYSAEQATRGETTFATNCTGCHTSSGYATPVFAKKWTGRPLGELFTLIVETMPEDAPGMLEPAEYAQVLAYLLKLNRMPAGNDELPADPEVLNRIRFDVKQP